MLGSMNIVFMRLCLVTGFSSDPSGISLYLVAGGHRQRDGPLGRSLCHSSAFSCHVYAMHTLLIFVFTVVRVHGTVAEWLACWTQAQKGPG